MRKHNHSAGCWLLFVSFHDEFDPCGIRQIKQDSGLIAVANIGLLGQGDSDLQAGKPEAGRKDCYVFNKRRRAAVWR